MNIAIAGTGYVGLSLACLLAQHNDVVAVDVVPEKVAMLQRWESPIRDEEIERFLAGAKSGGARCPSLPPWTARLHTSRPSLS